MSTMEATLKRYAEYAREHLVENHFGVLPWVDGWVIYSNQGHSAQADRFLALLKEEYGTSEPVWDDSDTTVVVAMEGVVEGEPECQDIADMWCDAWREEDAVDVVTSENDRAV